MSPTSIGHGRTIFARPYWVLPLSTTDQPALAPSSFLAATLDPPEYESHRADWPVHKPVSLEYPFNDPRVRLTRYYVAHAVIVPLE